MVLKAANPVTEIIIRPAKSHLDFISKPGFKRKDQAND
jgi:hypothetical protein